MNDYYIQNCAFCHNNNFRAFWEKNWALLKSLKTYKLVLKCTLWHETIGPKSILYMTLPEYDNILCKYAKNKNSKKMHFFTSCTTVELIVKCGNFLLYPRISFDNTDDTSFLRFLNILYLFHSMKHSHFLNIIFLLNSIWTIKLTSCGAWHYVKISKHLHFYRHLEISDTITIDKNSLHRQFLPPKTACFHYQLGRMSLFWMMENFFWKKQWCKSYCRVKGFSPMLRVFFGKDLLLFLGCCCWFLRLRDMDHTYE